MYRKSTLPNGLRVITERMPSVRSATIGVWADVGSSLELHERRGVSHMVEHMLFKGTSRRSARDIAQIMDGVGGNLNAFTDKEATCYYAKVMDRHLPLALDVLSDMFLHSLFDAGELAKERQVVLEEIKMYEDSPDELIHDLFLQTMWNGSNLGEPTIGFAETVSGLTPDDLRSHMRERYAPNSVVVTAAGNVDHDEFAHRVERAFAEFSGVGRPFVLETPATTPARAFKQKDSEQAYCILGTQGLSATDDRRYALSVLDTMLGGGMSSRLFQEIREKRGLVYTVYSFQAAYRAAGLFGIYAGTSPKNVSECVELDRCGVAENARNARRFRRADPGERAHKRKSDAVARVELESHDPFGTQRVRIRATDRARRNRAPDRCGYGRRTSRKWPSSGSTRPIWGFASSARSKSPTISWSRDAA